MIKNENKNSCLICATSEFWSSNQINESKNYDTKEIQIQQKQSKNAKLMLLYYIVLLFQQI